MRSIQNSVLVKIPDNVKITLTGRNVKVTGPRGTLQRTFNSIPVEFTRAGKNQIKVTVWFGNLKHNACIRTTCSHINNMIKGVTLGFQYKMRSAYAHFPINLSIMDNNKRIEIRNFIGERIVRNIPMLEGVSVEMTGQKDEIIIHGNDLQNVSQSAASIQNITKVKGKDIRMFLDGIYVVERSTVVKAD